MAFVVESHKPENIGVATQRVCNRSLFPVMFSIAEKIRHLENNLCIEEIVAATYYSVVVHTLCAGRAAKVCNMRAYGKCTD